MRRRELVAVEPGKHIAFGWTFPPFGPEFNTKPFPTWLEASFNPEDPDESIQ